MDNITTALSLFLPQSVATLLAPALAFIPARFVLTFLFVASMVISACNIIRIWWTPPAAGTKAAKVYALISFIAAKKGFNAGAYGPGYKSLAIPVSADRETIAEAAGIPAKNPKDLVK